MIEGRDVLVAEAAAQFTQALERLVESARNVNLRDYEERRTDLLKQEVVAPLRELLAEATSVFTEILRFYDSAAQSGESPQSEPDEASFYGGIERTLATAQGARRIADLCFMARWELERKRNELAEGCCPADGWAAIAECGSARRRILKSAIAVETAICEHEGLNSTLKELYLTELKRSLETRRAYAVFRREFRRCRVEGGSSVKQALRTAGTAIARLIGKEIYEDLRATDRRQLRELQARILAWLGGDGGFDLEAGLKIWQDLSVFADLLLQVNHRAELREHDRAVLAEAYEALCRSQPPPSILPAEVRQKLGALLGRDSELDELIESGASASGEDWKDLSRRLLQVLHRGAEDRDAASGADGCAPAPAARASS